MLASTSIRLNVCTHEHLTDRGLIIRSLLVVQDNWEIARLRRSNRALIGMPVLLIGIDTKLLLMLFLNLMGLKCMCTSAQYALFFKLQSDQGPLLIVIHRVGERITG